MGKNEVLRDNVKKQIDINDYKDTKYGDILCYNSMGKLKIVTPLENTYRKPIIMSSGYIKYGLYVKRHNKIILVIKIL